MGRCGDFLNSFGSALDTEDHLTVEVAEGTGAGLWPTRLPQLAVLPPGLAGGCFQTTLSMWRPQSEELVSLSEEYICT